MYISTVINQCITIKHAKTNYCPTAKYHNLYCKGKENSRATFSKTFNQSRYFNLHRRKITQDNFVHNSSNKCLLNIAGT